MFKVAVILLIVITVVVLFCLVTAVIGVFGLGGPVSDWLFNFIDMDWLLKYQAFVSGSVAALLLLWAVALALFQLRTMGRTTYADLLLRVSEEWDSDPFIRSRHLILEIAPIDMEESEQRKAVKETMETVAGKGHENYFILTRPLDFLEGLAFLVRKNYIPLDDVHRAFGQPMVMYYQLFQDYIEEMRNQPGNSKAYTELSEVVKKLSTK